MLKWICFLVLLAASVAIFIIAPLGLVGHFINRFAPAGLPFIGEAFAVGLSLSIVSNSFLARWKSMRLALVSLVVLALAESLMSGATFYSKALADGTLDLIVGIGIVAIVAVQEFVLISGGIGMSLVLDRIGQERQAAQKKAERHSTRLSQKSGDKPQTNTTLTPTETTRTPTVAPMPRPMTRSTRLDDIRRVNASRNGNGPLTPDEIAAKYGVSVRTAERDVAAIKKAGVE